MVRETLRSVRDLFYGLSAILALLLMFCLAAGPAQAQCTLGSPTTWNVSGDGNWTTKTDWNPQTVPQSATTNVCITNGTSTVTLDTSADVANLQLASGNILNFNAGRFVRVNGGQVINDGAITINGGNGSLSLANNLALSGGGTLTLVSNPAAGGASFIVPEASGFTLSNSSTIQGAGIIGNASPMGVNNSGRIDANVAKSATSIGTLILNGTMPVTNTGTLEATNGGVLQLVSNVINAGGTISASGAGASVNIVGATIHGGTFTTANGAIQTVGSATLDGVTSGPITISKGSTYVAARSGFSDMTAISGTINNAGNIQLNGGNGNTGILELGGNTTLNGTGTLTLSLNPTGGGATSVVIGNGSLTNNSTIQGEGTIGVGSGLVLSNAGTVNANVVSSSTHSGVLTLTGSGDVINTGTLEATDNGRLVIAIPVNNSTGNIITTGSLSQVFVENTISGGTLNNSSGGIMETIGSATLDGATHGPLTITTGSTYFASASGSNTTDIEGTITNKGTIILLGGFKSGLLNLSGNVTLNGGGTVAVNDLLGSSDAVIRTNQGNVTLTNVDNTIEGSGIIGSGSLTVLNSGVIDASARSSDIDKGILILNGTGGVTNSFGGKGGLIEATVGTLQIATVVNNAGGQITASGGHVDVMGGTIQGGTLNTSGGGIMETVGSATLDGSTHGAITITANSTYTAARSSFNDTTNVSGTITNHGTLVLNGGNGASGVLALTANATLNGGGRVFLINSANGGAPFIEAVTPGAMLINTDNMIQGSGSFTGLGILNQAGGTFDANAPGQFLTIAGSGSSVTNFGTFIVHTNSTLEVLKPLTNIEGTPGTTETLAKGTFSAFNGTMQINSFGDRIGGGELINNAATLTLNGPAAAITDANGNNALGNLSNNMAAGSLNVQGGYSFTTSAPNFTNAGSLNLGPSSSFTFGPGGTGTFTQSGTGASTVVSGKFTAGMLLLLGGSFIIAPSGNVDPLAINISGGTLQGAGSITGNVNNSGGNVEPASALATPGSLAINGNYTQGPGGLLTVDLGGIGPGEFSVLNVSDLAMLDGTVDFTAVNGFTPGTGDDFRFLLFGATSGDFAHVDFTNWTCPVGDTCTDVFGPNSLTLEITPSSSAVPEPSALLLLGTGILALAGYSKRKKVAARG
jgi:hypothetical protein